MSLLSPYWSKVNLFHFELKLKVFVMTKAVSNRDVCFIKAVFLLCEHGHFSLNFTSHGFLAPPANTIRVRYTLFYSPWYKGCLQRRTIHGQCADLVPPMVGGPSGSVELSNQGLARMLHQHRLFLSAGPG